MSIKFQNIICLLLIFLFLFPLAVSATNDEITSSTKISYGMDESFTMIIPSIFRIDEIKKETNADLLIENVMINTNSILKIYIKSDNYKDNWQLFNIQDKNDKMIYFIRLDGEKNNLINNDLILTINSGEAYNSQIKRILKFILDKTIKSGNYTDTLTFVTNVETK